MSINTVDIEGNEAPQKGTPVLQDAYLDVRFTPKLRFRAGKIKTPLGIQRLQSAQNLLFAERALTNNLVANRDVGLQVQGELDQGAVAYQLAVLNGVPDGVSVFSYASTVTANGDRTRWSPQGYFYLGPVGVLAEYVQARHEVQNVVAGRPTTFAELTNSAWSVSGSVLLTGEDAAYTNVKLKDFLLVSRQRLP